MSKEKAQDPKAQCVLEAATKIFLQHGFSAATTDMIQKEAGVSKATLYNRYPNKEALFVAVIEARCKLTTSQVNAIQVSFSSNDIEYVLTQIGRTYLNIILSVEGLALFRTVTAESVRFPHMAQTFYHAGPKAIVEIISRHMAHAAEKGEINIQTIGVEQAASVFVSMLRGEGQMEGLMFADTLPSRVQIEHWTKLAVQTFLKAFKA